MYGRSTAAPHARKVSALALRFSSYLPVPPRGSPSPRSSRTSRIPVTATKYIPCVLLFSVYPQPVSPQQVTHTSKNIGGVYPYALFFAKDSLDFRILFAIFAL
jgi:hypothetical protein